MAPSRMAGFQLSPFFSPPFFRRFSLGAAEIVQRFTEISVNLMDLDRKVIHPLTKS